MGMRHGYQWLIHIPSSKWQRCIIRWIGSAVLAVSLVVRTAGLATAASKDWSARGIGGIYAMSAIQYGKFLYPNGRIVPAVTSNSSIAGIVLAYNWSDVEIADGMFNWSKVDNEVGLASSAGLKATISINAGVGTPSWLYNEGAKSFSFKWNESWSFSPCTTQQIPIPWDPVFENKWGNFVQNFGARYDPNPTVASVKLTGFNSATSELYLPASVNQPININGTSCTSNNDVANWQAVGYRPATAEAALNQFLADFVGAFPNTPVTAMMVPGGFPPIDQNGNVIPSNKYVAISQPVTDVINNAISTYGQQFVLENDGLSSTWIWSLEESYAGQINTGYQMLSTMGSQLPAAISLGLSGNPAFLEIYLSDLQNNSLLETIVSAAGSL